MAYRKILIDSDVCLDVMLERMPFYTASARLLQDVEDGKYNGILSAESYSNIYYILRKLTNKRMAAESIRKLYRILKTGGITETTVEQAIYSGWDDFEDALQFFCAVELDCDAIITRNKKDFHRSGLPVLTPEQLLMNSSL